MPTTDFARKPKTVASTAARRNPLLPDRPSQIPQDLRRILGLRVPVSVRLAERQMNVESILEIGVGTIIEFDIPVESELTLLVSSHVIGKGHAVKCGENFGLNVSHVGSVHDRIDAMGGGGE